MSTLDQNLITQTKKSHNDFSDKCLKTYDEVFPVQNATMKTKNISSHWMIKRDPKNIKEEIVPL